MSVRRPSRAWIGAGLLAGAAALGVAGLVTATTGDPAVSAAPATIEVAPSTIAPVSTTPTPPTTSTVAPVQVPSPAAGTMPVTVGAPPAPPPTSPLAGLVGAAQSVEAQPAPEVPAPVGIDIATLGITYPVVPVGVQYDGQLEIPDETQVGWYELGAGPGQPGATVLAGHVNWHRVDGPFVQLRRLDPGAILTLTLADGTTRTYEVVERQQYGKLMLPTELIWTHTGPETLVLITCGGSFNPQIRHYRDNIVVYAVPVGTSAP
jgi:Sortase domain